MDAPRNNALDETNAIFAHLDPHDVEQFYASYQMWLLQQQIVEVQARIQSVTQQIAENQVRLQCVHPSAIALATLARLQSNGVNDIDLLDRMLARGENWLDCTMQRLAYCEKFDFMRDTYTDWCEHALEGAYDWIDSMDEAQIEHDTSPSSMETSEPNTLSDAAVDAQAQTTEELLLLKLMSDEDEALMQAATLKNEAGIVSVEQPVDSVEPTEPVELVQTEYIPANDVQVAEEDEVSEHSIVPLEQVPMQTDHVPTIDEVILPETNDTNETHDTSAAPYEQLTPAERIEVEELTATPTDEETHASSPSTTTSIPIEQIVTPETSQQSNLQSTRPRRKRSFLRRLITAFLGK